MKALKYWWPTIAWAAAIFLFSSGAFSYDNTSRFIIPLLRWLRPEATLDSLRQWHFLIRKIGHVSEYFLLSLLALRSLRGEASGWKWRWALGALLLCAGYAVTDELHQAFVGSRSATLNDVVLDGSGALVAQLCAALFMDRSGNETTHEPRWEKEA